MPRREMTETGVQADPKGFHENVTGYTGQLKASPPAGIRVAS
jgi:hypothetical protein